MTNSTRLFLTTPALGRVAVLKALFISFIAATYLAGQAYGAPLILAQPTNSTFYLGGTNNITFKVIAKGNPSPTYQWQVKATSSSSNSIVTGGTLSNLTISGTGITDTTQNGNKYSCVVSNTFGAITSATATLKVYNTPTVTPSVTLSTGTIPANSGSNITINISGLNPSDTVRIERFLDLNSDGIVDIGEPDVADFLITDGTSSTIGGVNNPNIPGDDDGVANGTIVTHISIPTSSEIGQTAGNYIIRVLSPTGEFAPILTPLVITQPAYGQTVSGQLTLTSGSITTPGIIVLLSNNGNNNNYVASCVTDTAGNYTLNAPIGSYMLLGLHIGEVSSMSGAPSFSLTSGETLTGENPILTPATCTISGQVQDVPNGLSLKGVQLMFNSTGNYFDLNTSDTNGNYVISAVVDQWQNDISEYNLTQLGYLATKSGTTTTVSGATSTLNISLNQASALISGTVKDSGGTPRSGIIMNANLGNSNLNATTGSNGSFTFAVSPGTWSVGISQDYANANNLVGMSALSEPINGGQAIGNLQIQIADATGTVSGSVSDSGSGVANASVYASATLNGISYNSSANTDNNGNYRFPILSGTWNMGVQSSLIFNNQTVVVTSSSTTVNFTSLPVIAHLTGTVTNNGLPVSGAYIGTQLSGSGSNPMIFATTGSDGRFDFGITSNGTWTITMENNYAKTNNWVGPSLTEIVTNSLSVFNINFAIVKGTEIISGTVLGSGSTPFTNTNVSATAFINGMNYMAQTYTDNSGAYSFPVISGSWTVNVSGSSNFIPQIVIIGGSSAQVNFLPPTPFQLWQQIYFNPTQMNQSNVSGLTALVSSGAGFTNQLAYALGLNPSIARQTNLPTVTQTMVSGTTYPLFHFTRNTTATDITYTVQTCSDLTGWTTLCSYSNGIWTPSNIVSENYFSTNINNVQIQDPVAFRSASKHFIRLNVTH